jgi:pyruvate dehydrogenase E1 component alpha subunit
MLAKGARTDQMMAEIYGKRTGINKGKAGSQHLADLSVGALGAEGIQGTPVVIATGAALSAKFRGTDQVAISFIGDGTLNTGSFHEGLNMAAAWKLPFVCVCENNMWACSTKIYEVTNLTELRDRAAGYGIPGIAIDGNDVLAVYEVVATAVSRAREGAGVTFIECRTCRLRAHYEGDTQTYRSSEEVDECRKRDPITRFRKKLIKMGVLTEQETNKIHREALAEMDRAVLFAEEGPFPDPEEVLTDVYA